MVWCECVVWCVVCMCVVSVWCMSVFCKSSFFFNVVRSNRVPSMAPSLARAWAKYP